MLCTCDNFVFNKRSENTFNNVQYCCPVGATVINGACGCDSTGATKVYLGANKFNIKINNSALK